MQECAGPLESSAGGLERSSQDLRDEIASFQGRTAKLRELAEEQALMASAQEAVAVLETAVSRCEGLLSAVEAQERASSLHAEREEVERQNHADDEQCRRMKADLQVAPANPLQQEPVMLFGTAHD